MLDKSINYDGYDEGTLRCNGFRPLETFVSPQTEEPKPLVSITHLLVSLLHSTH